MSFNHPIKFMVQGGNTPNFRINRFVDGSFVRKGCVEIVEIKVNPLQEETLTLYEIYKDLSRP